MATRTADPLGVVAEKTMLINQLSTLATAIASWSGDHNGLLDAQNRAAEISFRLNSLSSVDNNNAGTAFSQFGLENVSTS